MQIWFLKIKRIIPNDETIYTLFYNILNSKKVDRWWIIVLFELIISWNEDKKIYSAELLGFC